ncbi:MAG: HAD-IA family hydrolase [Planctomycetales bacterium]|nr:HAD-IA family hydrolase [Planctomycetales bacterium]
MASLPRQPLEPIRQADESDLKQRFGAVALDMDGLLFDTEPIYWQVGDTILQRRGHRYSAALQARMMGRIGVAAVQEMIDFHELDVSPEQLLSESDELYGNLLPRLLRPMPGLDEWIQHLQTSGVRFALTTSSRRKWVDIIFAELEWRGSLTFVLTGDDVSNGKPHPEMYLKAARQFDVPSSSLLVLEDSGNGCAAGVAAGAKVVAIPNEHTRQQDFTGAILVADSLADSRLWVLVSAEG